MEKRVYRGSRGKGLRYALLFLSLAVVLGGLIRPGTNADIVLGVSATATPIPTDEAFDESPASRRWSLPESRWYALQLGSFEDRESAETLAGQFRGRGAAGYVWADTRMRTLAALYHTRAEADSVRYKLWENHGVDAFAYEIVLPPLTLEMSGMKGQLDILEAAFGRAYALIEALETLSLTLDRQEITVAEANAALRNQAQQCEALTLRLKQRFTEPRHAAVSGLLSMMDAYAASARELDDDAASAALATDVKYSVLEALYALYTICDGLSAT